MLTSLVLLEGKVRPDGIGRLEEFLARQLPTTRAFDGCQSLDCYLNKEDRTLVIVQRWDAQQDYEDYLAWRKKTGVFFELEELFDDGVQIRYGDRLDV